MIEIGAFEAKTNFSAILAQIAEGEEFIITKRGKPVAKIMACNQAQDRRIRRQKIMEEIFASAKNNTLNLRQGETIKTLINEGRK